ncbi:MAG: type VI secretion system tip protein VgrG [Bacteroidota bacterium]
MASDTTLTVTMKLLSEGSDIGDPGIISVRVTHAVNAVAHGEVWIDDGDIAAGEFRNSNDPKFAPGKKLSIEIGHGTETEPVFEGIVVRHRIRSRRSGTSALCLELKHEAIKMHQARKTRHHIEMTDSDIVDGLISEYGLSGEVDGDMDLEHEKMIQYNVSDWDFVITRAEANGRVVYNEEDKVVVTAPQVSASDGVEVVLGDNVWEFEAEAEGRDQYSGGGGLAWDYLGQEEKTGTAEDPSDIEEQGNVDAAAVAGELGEGEFELRHPGALTETELIKWSSATLMRSRLAKVRGRLRVFGNLDYKVGGTVALDGFSDVFNGPAYISEVIHNVVGGIWSTEIQMGLAPEKYLQLHPDVIDAPVSGLVPPMRGLQIGTVREIEEDPQGQFRVLVKMATVNDEEDGIWARVAHADAGIDHTFFFQPLVGDEVVLGFLDEDPRHAIVLGSLHNSEDHKPPIEDNDDFAKKGIVTVEGLKMTFDDGTKSIILETPGGKMVTLDDDDQQIVRMEDENGNFIEMSSDGITIESAGEIVIKATQDLTAEGMNVTLSAQAQLLAEGAAGIEVSSNAVAVLKGSLVQIN